MLNIPEKIKLICDELAEGVLVIDKEYRVVYANAAYLSFLNMTAEEIQGRVLRDFRPHAQLPTVVASGKPVLHAQRLEGLEEAYFVNMYPLKVSGEIIGGLSIITFMSEAEKVKSQLDAYKAKVQNKVIEEIQKSSTKYTFDDIIAVSPETIAVKEFAQRLAKDDMTVLLESESGTGKELYAQAIHNASERKNNIFLAVNCANFNANILDSELFGYEEGAFTGAKKGGKIGLFEAARGGTLFLDEISEMDIALQAKLLRALQERKIRKVGGLKEIDIDVRLICASNANLKEYVSEGKFRKDLYYRLNTFPIHIPPLSKRREDIPAIVNAQLQGISHRRRQNITISDEALECLRRYDWPGNVRELKNVVEFSAYLCENDTIVLSSLPSNLVRAASETPEESLSEKVKRFERGEIEAALHKYGNDLAGKKAAAKALKISLATLYNKLEHELF